MFVVAASPVQARSLLLTNSRHEIRGQHDRFSRDRKARMPSRSELDGVCRSFDNCDTDEVGTEGPQLTPERALVTP